MNYYGTKVTVYKNNKTTPEETVIQPELFKTEEEAFKHCLKEADRQVKFYGYRPVGKPGQAFTETLDIRKNYKTGKETVYRCEWSVIKFKMEG